MLLTRIRISLIAAILTCAPAAIAQQSDAPPPDPAEPKARRQLIIANKPWTGDFDKMIERRMIRAFIPYSRTLYFNDRGKERGLTAELVRDFEQYINQKYRKELRKRPITVYLIPTTRDRLLVDVAAGLGDIAAGNITVTEDRLKVVDFVAPDDQKGVSELIATGPKSPPINSVDELSGKTVHVRPATSYYQSILAINQRFQKEGKAPVTIVPLPDALEDEDKLEMLNAGLFEFVVVDDWMGRMWAQILPNITLREDLVLRSGGKIGWAIRKGSPELKEIVLDFYKNFVKKQGVAEYRLKQYMKRIKQIKENTATAEWKRFMDTVELFR